MACVMCMAAMARSLAGHPSEFKYGAWRGVNRVFARTFTAGTRVRDCGDLRCVHCEGCEQADSLI